MALLLRLNKAAPLTNKEMDDNLVYLDTRSTSLEASKLDTANLLNAIKLIDGLGSGIDADRLHNMFPTDQAVNNSIVARDSSGNFIANVIYATNFVGTCSTALYAQSFDGLIGMGQGGTGVTSINPGFVKSNGVTLTSTQYIDGQYITGGIQGTASNVTGVVSLENGGTGTTTPSGARQNLGLVPGQTIQAYSPNLQNLSGMGTAGLMMRTLNGLYNTRTIKTGDGLQISNSNGVDGDPTISVTVIPVTKGGTGAITTSGARAALGAASADNATLTGIPVAPTASVGTSTGQIATTKFVMENTIQAGMIIFSAASAIPDGYLEANGGLASRAAYSNLFSAIGINFGNGDGSTTFQLPNWSVPTGFKALIKT